MSDLNNKHCVSYKAGAKPLSEAMAKEMLKQIHTDWQLSNDDKEINRLFEFKNYYQTMAFVNAAAWISHQEDHHPDIEVGYSKCLVRYSTHAIGGLSENDFICAFKIDLLTKPTD